MRALVTGASGFVGNAIARYLVEVGDNEVTAIGSRSENEVPNAKLFLSTHCSGVDWDRINYDIDVLFHQAANNDTLCKDKEEIWRSNVDDTEMIFEEALDRGCKHFVYASSTAVYGNATGPFVVGETPLQPLNLYGESKVAMEEFAAGFAERNPEVSVVGLRYCNIYGHGEAHKGRRASMIFQLVRDMRKGLPPRVFKHGEHQRAWIYIEDIIQANLCAATYNGSGVFGCGTEECPTFNELIAEIQANLRTNLETEYVDCPFKTYQGCTATDMSVTERELGFYPEYDYKRGIRMMCL